MILPLLCLPKHNTYLSIPVMHRHSVFSEFRLVNYRSENVLNLQVIAFKKPKYCKISHLKTKYSCKISHFTKKIRTFAPFKDT